MMFSSCCNLVLFNSWENVCVLSGVRSYRPVSLVTFLIVDVRLFSFSIRHVRSKHIIIIVAAAAIME